MFKSTFFKLLLTFLVVIIIIMGLMFGMQEYFFSREYLLSRVQEIQYEAIHLANQMSEKDTLGDTSTSLDTIELISNKYDALIWVLDKEGNIIQTQKDKSDFVGKSLPAKQMNDFLYPILEGKIVTTTEFYQTQNGLPVITVGVPIFQNGVIAGAVVINTFETVLASFSRQMVSRLWFMPLIVFGVAMIFVLIASRRLTRPVKAFKRLANEAGKGNFAYRVPIKSEDTELGQIGESLNQMMEKLSKMDKLRSDFVQNASHELKAPITVISGYSQALMDSSLTEDKRQEYLDIIQGETRRMSELIGGMMTLSQIETGNQKLNREHFNINDLISRMILSFELEIEKKQLEVEVHYESDVLEVYADQAKIEQVVVNLLQNALKYTREKDSIIVTTKQVKAKAYVEIKDTGIGIEKKEIGSIFDRFYTVDKAKTPGKGGSGIGLSLVKKILQLHGSQINVESQPGAYSRFWFYLDM